MAALEVHVVAADREVWAGEASMLVARTVEGALGIMPGHEPFLGVLAEGEVRIHTDGGIILAKADRGFLSVENNTVMVVASQAELVA